MCSVFRLLARAVLVAACLALAGCKLTHDQTIERSLYRVLTLKPSLGGSIVGRGSAFKVSGTQTVVTNYHVVQNATTIVLVYWSEGRFEEAEARIEHADPTTDLALLRTVKPLPGHPLPIARYTPDPGSEAWALGFPGAADALFGRITSIDDFLSKLTADPSMSQPTRTFGTISSERQRGRVTYLQHQVPTNPGSSGSPLIDACGTVVGINTLAITNANSVFGAVSSRELLELMRLRSIDATASGGRCWVIFEPRYAMLTTAAIGAFLLLAAGLLMLARFLWMRSPRSELRRSRAPLPRNVQAPPGKVIDITPVPLDLGPDRAEAQAEIEPRWAPAVGPSGIRARLFPIAGGRPFDLQSEVPGSIVIGRGSDCSLVIDEPTISRRHCRLDVGPTGEIRAFDLGSGNGTRINGAPVAGSLLRSGDTLGLGALELRIEIDSAKGSGAAAARRAVRWHMAAVAEQRTVASLTIDGSDAGRTWIIGRGGQSDLVIPSSTVSATHATLRLRPDGGLEIQDMTSSNGTFVRGRRLGREWTDIGEADEIALGSCVLNLRRQ